MLHQISLERCYRFCEQHLSRRRRYAYSIWLFIPFPAPACDGSSTQLLTAIAVLNYLYLSSSSSRCFWCFHAPWPSFDQPLYPSRLRCSPMFGVVGSNFFLWDGTTAKRYVDKLAERALGAAAAEGATPASQMAGAEAVRIHAAWNQTSARTGRLSCSRPNLQQVISDAKVSHGHVRLSPGRMSHVKSRRFVRVFESITMQDWSLRRIARTKRHPGMRRFGVSTLIHRQVGVHNANCLAVLAPLCSTELQIPKSSDPLAGVAGVNVRDAFAASKSFTLMAADYSQIEVCPL